MKNKIITSSLVFVMLFAGISLAHAQTAQPVITDTVISNTELQTLLQLLEQELALLEQEYAQLTTQVSSIASSTIATATPSSTGQIGTAASTTSYTPSPTLSQIESTTPEVVTPTPVIASAPAPAPITPTSTTYEGNGLTINNDKYYSASDTIPMGNLNNEWTSCIGITYNDEFIPNVIPLNIPFGTISETGNGEPVGYSRIVASEALFITVSTDSVNGLTEFTVNSPSAIEDAITTNNLEQGTESFTGFDSLASANPSSTFPMVCASGTAEIQ